MPRKDKNILMHGWDRTIAFISNPPPEIRNGIKEMADKLERLEQEREIMLKNYKVHCTASVSQVIAGIWAIDRANADIGSTGHFFIKCVTENRNY